MTTAQDLNKFINFNARDSIASLWVFKKKPFFKTTNLFTAVSVNMSPEMETKMKSFVSEYQQTYTTSEPYSLLAEPK